MDKDALKLKVRKIAPEEYKDAFEIVIPPYTIVGDGEAIPLYLDDELNPNGGWQYHKLGFKEFIKVKNGVLTIDVGGAYGTNDITRARELLRYPLLFIMPQLIVHRLINHCPTTLTLEVYFNEPWNSEREPIFDTEEEAWESLANYLLNEEYRQDKERLARRVLDK